MKNKIENLGGLDKYTTATILIRNGIYNVMDAKIIKETKGESKGCITFFVKGFSFYSILHRGKADLVDFQDTIDKIIKFDEYGIYSESLGYDKKSKRIGIAIDNKVHGRRYEDFEELREKKIRKKSFWDFFRS